MQNSFMPVLQWSVTRCEKSSMLQVNVGLAWICALATLILVPSDIYHAMQVGVAAPMLCWTAHTTGPQN